MDLKNQNIKYIFSRCNDRNENNALKDLCRNKIRGIKFEYSGSRTSQINGSVERKFQRIYGPFREMVILARLQDVHFGRKSYVKLVEAFKSFGFKLITACGSKFHPMGLFKWH